MEMGQCHCLASGGFPSTHLIFSHFTHFPYGTGTLPAVILVVNPRVDEFVYILSLCSLFKQTLLKIWQFLPLLQPSLVFTTRSYGDLFCGCWNPGLCSLAWGWDGLLPKYSSQFLSTTHECRNTLFCLSLKPPSLHATSHLCMSTCIPTTPPLLPVSMNVAFLNLWLSDFYTAQFSESSGCYLL